MLQKPNAHRAGKTARAARGIDARDQLGGGDTPVDRGSLERFPDRGLGRDRGAVAGDGEGPLARSTHRHTPVGVTASALQPHGVRARSRARPASSLLALGGAILPPHAVEAARLQRPLGGALAALVLGNAEARAFLIGAALALGGLLLLAVAVQVDDASHHASGPIIFLGSTILSNSSADT